MAKSKPTKETSVDQKPRGRKAPPIPGVVTQAAERIVPSPPGEMVRELPEWVPVLALRDVVIYPFMIFPVLVGRESSLGSVTAAIGRERYLFLVAQRDATQEEPKADELYQFGTLAKVVRIIRLPNGLMKVLVDGLDQAMATEYSFVDGHLEAKLTILRPTALPMPELEALTRHASDLFKQYVKESRVVPQEVLMAFDNIPDPRRKLFYIAAHLTKDLESKQHILEITDLRDQYLHLTALLVTELDILKIEQEIDEKVQSTIQKSQRKYFLAEQIRVLQEELGEEIDEQHPEFGKLVEQLNVAGLPEQARARADEELERLKKQPPMSPEGSVIRTYLEWLAQVPWKKRTLDHLNIEHVREVLERDHYGLEKPKERILEHIAVLNLVEKMRGQILCLVGPPGVGKTSLARSIASALGREFVRISLGGVRDEAEIRGHRRTYIGSLPGKIIQSMKRVGVVNPLMLLDEVDKMSMDFRGDPSSALLEVLDPEQNHTFTDHYLEVDYDLSNVFFVTTANVRYNIPLPLADRMEIIELPGYLEHDKLQIAKRHIIPNQLRAHGLPESSLTFEDAALLRIIRQYTEEAGVRSLVRQIARICRKVAREIVSKAYQSTLSNPSNGHAEEAPTPIKVTEHGICKAEENGEATEKQFETEGAPREPLQVPEGFHVTITAPSLDEYLGVPKHMISKSELGPKIGAVMGLAWTSTGGDVLPVETVLVDGSERLTLTGQLGDVMKESAQAALTFIRARYKELKIPRDFTKRKEIHVHLPEGAIPKDGPSAGITLIMAIISAATGKPVRGDLAMTGEITLRGNVLPIGGLQEKLLAAKRAGIKVVIIPEDNRPSLAEIPTAITEGLNIISVKTVDQAIPVVFDLTTPASELKARKPEERKEIARVVRTRKKTKPKARRGPQGSKHRSKARH
ncbi:MAG TPA: endopeptidase La [Candidatus Kapabacteria bacterium]|nr:endopeptidase La [Candidatus Kapabacteria bacterium]